MDRQLVDIDALRVKELADTFVGEDDQIAALLYRAADRLDRLQTQIDHLQPNDFDLGVKTAYERVYGRRNIQPESRPVDSRLAEALAKFPVKKIPRGVSGLPEPTFNKPTPRAAKTRESELAKAGIKLDLEF